MSQISKNPYTNIGQGNGTRGAVPSGEPSPEILVWLIEQLTLKVDSVSSDVKGLTEKVEHSIDKAANAAQNEREKLEKRIVSLEHDNSFAKGQSRVFWVLFTAVVSGLVGLFFFVLQGGMLDIS